MDKRCERCGGPLPDWATMARQYCDVCRKDVQRERNERYRAAHKDIDAAARAERRNEQRFCADCGTPLPIGCHLNKLYCRECADRRHHQDAVERMRRYRAEKRPWTKPENEKPKEKPKERSTMKRNTVQIQPITLRLSDEKYCSPCRFVGSFTEGYLCNFILMTGERRGCPAGVGCVRRETR